MKYKVELAQSSRTLGTIVVDAENEDNAWDMIDNGDFNENDIIWQACEDDDLVELLDVYPLHPIAKKRCPTCGHAHHLPQDHAGWNPITDY